MFEYACESFYLLLPQIRAQNCTILAAFQSICVRFSLIVFFSSYFATFVVIFFSEFGARVIIVTLAYICFFLALPFLFPISSIEFCVYVIFISFC